MPTMDEIIQQLMQVASQMESAANFELAEKIYGDIAAIQPTRFDALHRIGVVRYRQGRMAGAAESFAAALALRPDDPTALSNLGLAQLGLGLPEDALASWDRALAVQPHLAMALVGRGDTLLRLARPDEAVASYDRALALDPGLAEAHNNRGAALLDLRRPHEALASFGQALALRPDFADALNGYGNALSQMKRQREALDFYDRAIAARSQFAQAFNNRGVALRELGRSAEAVAAYERAIAIDPGYAAAHNNRGAVLSDLKRPEEALDSYAAALAVAPDHAAAYDNMGLLLAELGRLGESRQAYEKAIALSPRTVRFYYNLVNTNRLAEGDPLLAALRALAADQDALAVDERIELDYALGKVLADLGDHAGAFARFQAGASLKRSQIAYDEPAVLAGLARIRDAWPAEPRGPRRPPRDPFDAPVFIVGMPRSGTSLVEQILASHPEVHAAGETDAFARALVLLQGGQAGAFGPLDGALKLSQARAAKLAALYRDQLGGPAMAGARRVTDKTLENYRFIGLIRRALPNARIIHVRRAPLDTGLSCFTRAFVGYLPYTYDLAELGRYYRAYDALMRHWLGVISPEALLEVRYEAVVADLEGQARRLVAHCGLDWDPRCLDFHTTQRLVRTASAAQVRQPIYAGSVGRWRDYQPFLGPLIEALGPLARGEEA